jgi:hypothetical protein
MSDPAIPEDATVTARFPELSIDAPSAAAAGEPQLCDDPDACPVPITAVSAPEDDKALAEGMRAKANPAEWMFDRIVRLIQDFESKLNPEEEVGAHLVQAPGEGAFHIVDVGFWGPDMIMFYGKNSYGRPVRLLQHYEQVSLLLTALPKARDVPRRIGFQLREKLEKAAAEGAEAPKAAPAPREGVIDAPPPASGHVPPPKPKV